MISGANLSFQQNPQCFQLYDGMEDSLPSPADGTAGSDTHSHSLFYNLSVLRDKVQQVQSLVSSLVSHDPIQQEAVAMAIARTGALIQDIIASASSLMYDFQQVAISAIASSSRDSQLPQEHMKPCYDQVSSDTNIEVIDHVLNNLEVGRRGFMGAETHYSNIIASPIIDGADRDHKKPGSPSNPPCDIIELDAAHLLAKYTHYCQVCGKGFKRDANLRMHMRAHGDEYKTNEALSNPTNKDYSLVAQPRKYSCPQEGCRWNRNHTKFQPLKSMICVKNHYKRSHCPKMYVCNRCNRKQFSVLSDLRTHEKHCGRLKWQCSCGTTFSRKDKLMGHVALFTGHVPALNCVTKQGDTEYQEMQVQEQGR